MSFKQFLTESMVPKSIAKSLSPEARKALRMMAQGGRLMGVPEEVRNELDYYELNNEVNPGLVSDVARHAADIELGNQEPTDAELEILERLVYALRRGNYDNMYEEKRHWELIQSLFKKGYMEPTPRQLRGRIRANFVPSKKGRTYKRVNENEDRMAAIRRAAQGQQGSDARFAQIRDSLSPEEIAVLRGSLSRKRGKRGASRGVSPELAQKFSDLGLGNEQGIPNAIARNFMQWYDSEEGDNRSQEDITRQKRMRADDYLARGEAKRTNTTPTNQGESANFKSRAQKLARQIAGNEQNKDLFRRLFKRMSDSRVDNPASVIPASIKRQFEELEILDQNGEFTEYGEFAIKFVRAFMDDPRGVERTPRSEQPPSDFRQRRRSRRRY